MRRTKVKEVNTKKAVDNQVNALFSENALKMMRKRYLFTRRDGSQETPADMFHRVSHALAGVEAKYGHNKTFIEKTEKAFFEILANREYTPAGRTLTNAGGPTPLIANCIVLPVLDSMESIFGTLKDATLLQQAGSGLGFDFSHLRPAMTPTKKSNGVASGPVSFLKVYNEAFGVIKQQCFAKGTLIVTKRGVVPIEQVRRGDATYTERGWKRVTEVFLNGVRETVKLTLDCGYSVQVTPEHKVAVLDGSRVSLKQVKHLTKHDTLLMKLGGERLDVPSVPLAPVTYQKNKYTCSQLRDIREPDALDEDLAYFLGWYFADGWNDARGIGLVLPLDPAVTAYAVKLVVKLFGVRPLLSRNGEEQCQRLKINSRWVLKYLAHNGLLKQRSPKLVFPEKILVSSSLVQRAFIAGFFDGDGDNGKNYRINSTSRPFITSLQLVLLTNGIASKVRGERKQGTTWRTVYRLSIIGKIFTHAFYEALSPYSWKIQKKEKTKDFGWIFPFHGYAYKSIRRIHDGVRSTMSYAALQSMQLVTQLQPNAVASITSTLFGFVPVHVSHIVRSGIQEVYDFEVEDVHMINAGIYTSNSRHGANMAMMRIDHPDVLDFIRAKEVEGDIRNFNISVQITDEFMKAVTERPNDQWYCTWNGKKMKPHKVLHARSGAVTGAEEINITVKQLFDEIVHYAWLNGEPGVFFVDEVNRTNPLPGLGPIDCTNPCGEQALHHYDNCNLGSLNLASFAKGGTMDWARLRSVTKTATRLMDNVIDLFDFPVEKVTALAKKNRRIGLGIMGFADMLYELGVAYNSLEGARMAERVMKTINETAHQASRELAKEKGTFPNIELSVFGKKYGPLRRSESEARGKRDPHRNAALTTVAPTGSISMMFDCSSGIEPNFALAYVKQDKDGHQYHYFNRHFEAALAKERFPKEKIREIKDEVIRTGSIQGLKDLPGWLKKTFVVAMDISAEDHMKMQAAFQRNVDNSISKTINFPNSATEEDVARGYVMAWRLRCKSATVYRDGSRSVQILNLGTGENLTAPSDLSAAGKAKKLEVPPLDLAMDKNRLAPRTRPKVMHGKTYKIKTGYGSLFLTINDDEGGVPFEIFATIGKSGGFFQEQSEAICRLVSLSLRSGIKVETVIDQLRGIRGPMPVMTEKGTVLSLPDAIAQMLEEHARSSNGKLPRAGEKVASKEFVAVSAPEGTGTLTSTKSIADYGFMPGCPDCGNQLTMGEGCLSCKSCGFSRCL